MFPLFREYTKLSVISANAFLIRLWCRSGAVENGTVAIGNECAYRVVIEVGVILVQPCKGLFVFVEEANSGFV